MRCGAVRCGPAVLDFFAFMAQDLFHFIVSIVEHNTTQHNTTQHNTTQKILTMQSKDTPSLLFFASHPCCFFFCVCYLWEECDTDDDTTVSSVDAPDRETVGVCVLSSLSSSGIERKESPRKTTTRSTQTVYMSESHCFVLSSPNVMFHFLFHVSIRIKKQQHHQNQHNSNYVPTRRHNMIFDDHSILCHIELLLSR